MKSYNPINWESLDKDIISAIEDAKAENGYSNVGIRIQAGIAFEEGPINHISHIWVDGDDTGVELSGICAISAQNISSLCKNAGYYFGDHVAIIVGDVSERGEDPDEVIMTNAEVYKVLA